MMDGVVRAPSLFSITLGVLPSMMATHEFVVPRSMPMIRPISISPSLPRRANASSIVGYLWIRCGVFKLVQAISIGLLRRRHGDQRGPQHAVGDQVALLQHAHHGVGILWS